MDTEELEKAKKIFDKIKVGTMFYCDMRYKNHIVGILDKEDMPQIVYKYFGKRKKWWHYEIVSMYSFYCNIEIGLWKLFSKKEKNNGEK